MMPSQLPSYANSSKKVISDQANYVETGSIYDLPASRASKNVPKFNDNLVFEFENENDKEINESINHSQAINFDQQICNKTLKLQNKADKTQQKLETYQRKKASQLKIKKLNESLNTSISSRQDPFKDNLGMMRLMSFTRKKGGFLAHKLVKDKFKDVDAEQIYQQEITFQEQLHPTQDLDNQSTKLKMQKTTEMQSINIKLKDVMNELRAPDQVDNLHRKPCLFYPQDCFKSVFWDMIMALCLLITCLIVPFNMAFSEELDQIDWFIQFVLIIDIFFSLDILINFNTAILINDEVMELEDDRKEIACIYLKGWFLIDLLSVIPFDVLVTTLTPKNSAFESQDGTSKMNQFVRLTKVSKLQKLVKITRMIRLLKVFKKKKQISKKIKNLMQFGALIERLIFFGLCLFILCHFVGCFWIFIARSLNDEETMGDSWIEAGSFDDDMMQLYVVSLYFTMQTLTTVGYGDIQIVTSSEKIICIVQQLGGIITFSFLAGAITNMIQNFDSSLAANQEKIMTLNRLYKDYDFQSDLYFQIMNQIQNVDDKKVFQETLNFLESLPFRMKISLIMILYKEQYGNVRFLRNMDENFLGWICPLLKQEFVLVEQYIYYETDLINDVYFMPSGTAGFVLPLKCNKVYIEINQGDHFGEIDLLISARERGQSLHQMFDNMYKRKYNLQRQFTVQAVKDCKLLALSLHNLQRMHNQFNSHLRLLFKRSNTCLHNALYLKVEAIRDNRRDQLISSSKFRKANRKLYQKYGILCQQQSKEEFVSSNYRKQICGKLKIKYSRATKLLCQIRELQPQERVSEQELDGEGTESEANSGDDNEISISDSNSSQSDSYHSKNSNFSQFHKQPNSTESQINKIKSGCIQELHNQNGNQDISNLKKEISKPGNLNEPTKTNQSPNTIFGQRRNSEIVTLAEKNNFLAVDSDNNRSQQPNFLIKGIKKTSQLLSFKTMRSKGSSTLNINSYSLKKQSTKILKNKSSQEVLQFKGSQTAQQVLNPEKSRLKIIEDRYLEKLAQKTEQNIERLQLTKLKEICETSEEVSSSNSGVQSNSHSLELNSASFNLKKTKKKRNLSAQKRRRAKSKSMGLGKNIHGMRRISTQINTGMPVKRPSKYSQQARMRSCNLAETQKQQKSAAQKYPNQKLSRTKLPYSPVLYQNTQITQSPLTPLNKTEKQKTDDSNSKIIEKEEFFREQKQQLEDQSEISGGENNRDTCQIDSRAVKMVKQDNKIIEKEEVQSHFKLSSSEAAAGSFIQQNPKTKTQLRNPSPKHTGNLENLDLTIENLHETIAFNAQNCSGDLKSEKVDEISQEIDPDYFSIQKNLGNASIPGERSVLAVLESVRQSEQIKQVVQTSKVSVYSQSDTHLDQQNKVPTISETDKLTSIARISAHLKQDLAVCLDDKQARISIAQTKHHARSGRVSDRGNGAQDIINSNPKQSSSQIHISNSSISTFRPQEAYLSQQQNKQK